MSMTQTQQRMKMKLYIGSEGLQFKGILNLIFFLQIHALNC
jgi:hypothetical protein